MELASSHPSGNYNFEMAKIFLENLCTLVQKHSSFILHGSTLCDRTLDINTMYP